MIWYFAINMFLVSVIAFAYEGEEEMISFELQPELWLLLIIGALPLLLYCLYTELGEEEDI